MAITLSVLLWTYPGQADALTTYEDAVLALLPDYGGAVVARVRSASDDPAHPTEVQVLTVPDAAAIEAFVADPRRQALAAARDAAIARTEVIPGERIV